MTFQGDATLAAVLNIVAASGDHPDGMIGLTLFVGGQVVSGRVIRSSQWTRETVALFPADDEFWRPVMEAAGKSMAQVETDNETRYEAAVGLPDSDERSQEIEATLPSHIHLKNATVIVGSVAKRVPGVLRFRLTAVDGWAWGEISELG